MVGAQLLYSMLIITIFHDSTEEETIKSTQRRSHQLDPSAGALCQAADENVHVDVFSPRIGDTHAQKTGDDDAIGRDLRHPLRRRVEDAAAHYFVDDGESAEQHQQSGDDPRHQSYAL